MAEVLISLAIAATLVVAAAAKPPNVVVILTDDQGWGDLSLNGNTNLSTPEIDSLAKDGARFESFFVCPVCSPTRAEFLTGRYHQRGGVHSTSAGGERLDLDESTVADAFRAAGYKTGAFGKWHNGTQFPYHPNGRGFETFYGFCSGHWGDYFSPMLERDGAVVRGEGFCIDDFTSQAIEFMASAGGRPFFVYLPYNTPHSPMQVPDEDWARFESKELEMRHRNPKAEDVGHTRAALAMCENIDRNVGRVLKKLDELGEADNTIVVFFCDNGPNGKRWNGGMKGRKGSTDEGGVRSPLLVRWPEKIPAGRVVKTLGSAIDLYPTLAALAGVPMLAPKPVDGVSLADVLLGGLPGELAERRVFSSWKKGYSVRTARFRLGTGGGLFDMVSDPGQIEDVAAEHPDVHRQLSRALSAYKEEMVSEPGRDERPFVIAHPGHRFTWIPARDGEGSGAIKRSNRYPNDSFFENWTNTSDVVTWDAEVLAEGDYTATIYYTCPPDSVGTVLELDFMGGKVSATVKEFHDPVLQGAADDRVPRAESYVKDFKPLEMGVLRMGKGKGDLTLRALKKPGREVVDVRLILLERAE